MKMLTTTLACLVAAAVVPSAANAATIVVDVTGARSVGAFGNAGNTLRTINLGAGTRITGVGYQVNITAFSPSYLSEASLAFTNSGNTDGVFLTPGVGRDLPGTEDYADAVDLIDIDLDFALGADGILRLEFFDSFDDGAVNPDAIWNSGAVTFRYETAVAAVPEPMTWAMMTLGFGGIGFAMRRRKVTTRIRFA